jgi:DNA mismatch endonuclease (patch repair protein)
MLYRCASHKRWPQAWRQEWLRRLVRGGPMDKVDSSTRSRIMSMVRGSGNKSTEWRLRAWLIGAGIKGWKLGVRSKLPGRPDFIFPRTLIAIFVDGCFWHGCRICARRRKSPRTNATFWRTKIRANMVRDRRQNLKLRRLGWTVIRLAEHRLTGSAAPVLERIKQTLAVHGTGNGTRRPPNQMKPLARFVRTS